MTIDWNTVEAVEPPKGAYISWGTKPGQHVTGRVTIYDPVGGTTYDGDPCPALAVELTEPAASINRDGDRTNYPAGELVQLNVGQVGLQRKLRQADPQPGDLIRIELTALVKTDGGRSVKEFTVKTIPASKNGKPGGKPAPAKAAAVADDDEPPF